MNRVLVLSYVLTSALAAGAGLLLSAYIGLASMSVGEPDRLVIAGMLAVVS